MANGKTRRESLLYTEHQQIFTLFTIVLAGETTTFPFAARFFQMIRLNSSLSSGLLSTENTVR